MPSAAVRLPHARSSAALRLPNIRQEPVHQAVLDRHWDGLLVCLVIYVLASIGRIHQLLFLDVLRPALLAATGAIVLYLLDQQPVRRAQWSWTTTTKILVTLLAWMVICIPTALVAFTSIDLVLQNFARTVIMLLVLVGAVRGIRDVERLAATYLIGVALYAAFTLAAFNVTVDSRLHNLLYYDSNDFATLIVTAVPISLHFLHAAHKRPNRWLSGLALIILALAFVRAGSRGGFVALAAVMVYVILRYDAITLRQRIGATALAALVGLASASDLYLDRIAGILEEKDYNWTEEAGRLQIWQRGITYTLTHPIFGVGPGNFPAAEGMLAPYASRQDVGIGVRWNAAHNSYLQVAAELGFVGLVLFVSLIVATFRSLRRYRRQLMRSGAARSTPDLSQALTASVIGFVFGAFFLSLAYHEMLYMLVAMSAALVKVGRLQTRTR